MRKNKIFVFVIFLNFFEEFWNFFGKRGSENLGGKVV